MPVEVPLALIQGEYLSDLQCRVSRPHFRGVKSRIDRSPTALDVTDVRDLQPVLVIRYRNQRRAEGASNRTANLVVDSPFSARAPSASGSCR